MDRVAGARGWRQGHNARVETRRACICPWRGTANGGRRGQRVALSGLPPGRRGGTPVGGRDQPGDSKQTRFHYPGNHTQQGWNPSGKPHIEEKVDRGIK